MERTAIHPRLGGDCSELPGKCRLSGPPLCVGDGLVPPDSALGRHRDPARCLDFPPERPWLVYRINRPDPLCHPEVCAQLLRWLAPGNPG